jgi:hypothetical protein
MRRARGGEAGARKVLLMTHLAGYGLLAAILLIYSRTGSALWTDPAVAHAFTGGVYTLMLVALLAKSVQFPLHTWIPEAMNAPTPVSALLHAACYVKAGVYLAARMHCFNQWPASWSLAMMWLGTVTMVVGVAYAMVQHDLKRMLAFHTVSQIGYIITGLGLGTPLGIAAGLLHCLNHSLFKGGLFLAAGSVQHATGTRDMNQLGGLARRMPRTTVVWLISVGSMMGVPFMSGFASKWLLYTAALQAGQVVPALARLGSERGHGLLLRESHQLRLSRPHHAADPKTRMKRLPPWSGRSDSSPWAACSGPGSATGRELHHQSHSAVAGHGHGAGFLVRPHAGRRFLVDHGRPGAGCGFSRRGHHSLLPGRFMSRARSLSHGDSAACWLAGATGGGGVGVFTGGESIVGPSRLPASEFSVILKKPGRRSIASTDVDRVYLACGAYCRQSLPRMGRVNGLGREIRDRLDHSAV